jgi:antitoxin ParD1/3/4
MPTRQIVLDPDQDGFLEQVLQSGDYRDASEAVSDALRALRLERLRLAVAQGVAALDRGDFSEVADEDLDAYLDSLPAR